MASSDALACVRHDLNSPVFQDNLLNLQKPDRLAALDTLAKIRHLNWEQPYKDNWLKWGKINSIKPQTRIDVIYSMCITQARRATAYREGDVICLLTIAPDHDCTYGRK